MTLEIKFYEYYHSKIYSVCFFLRSIFLQNNRKYPENGFSFNSKKISLKEMDLSIDYGSEFKRYHGTNPIDQWNLLLNNFV